MTISKEKTFRNIGYSVVAKGATLICAALTSLVVARNLTPSDYGVVGFATIIIGFLAHFSDLGVGTAAIRRPQLDQRSLSTAFTAKLVLSSAAVAGAFLIAPFVHFFFRHPATGNVLRFLALNFLVSTIGFTAMVTLTREQNFRALRVPGIVGAVVRLLLAFTLIRCGAKYWAVVAGDVGATLAAGIVLQATRRTAMSFHFDREVGREYLKFGLPLFGSGVLVFLIFNMDNFLVGWRMGNSQLGYYALAFSWGSFVCGMLADTVNSVMLPTLSAIQHDLDRLRRWYLKTVDLAAFVSVAANTALLANARYFLVTLLGKGSEKWLPAAQALEILCIYGILRAITEPLGPLLMARGETSPMLKATVLAGALEMSALFLVLRTGRIELVAAVVLLSYMSQAIIYLPVLRTNLGIRARDIAAQAWPVIPAVVAGYVFTSFLPASLGTTVPTLAARGLLTASVTVLVHGLCTQFRCFQEARGVIWKRFATAQA